MVKDYQKKCEPSVTKHMQEVSLVDFVPRTDNFSEPSFSVQLKLLLKRQGLYMVRVPYISAAQIIIAIL
jgi:hypothetical protein